MDILNIDTANSIFSGVAQKYLKEILVKAPENVKKLWKFFNIDNAEKVYLENVESSYNKIRIWPMASPVNLRDIFTYVNILNKLTASRRISENQQKQLERAIIGKSPFGSFDQKEQKGINVVKKIDKLFIFGKPGAGKTTFLKYIALQCIDKEINFIPIFIKLRDLSTYQGNIFEYIVNEFDVCNFPESDNFISSMMKTGKAILLFDGLDEIRKEDGDRDKAIKDIVNFTRKYRKCKIVITCRIAAPEYSFDDFTYVEISDFNDKQVNFFVTNWFKKRPQFADLFFKELKRSDIGNIYHLSKIPLLLTLLCIVFEETRSFRTSRAQIYDDGINLMLRKIDSDRGVLRSSFGYGLDYKRIQEMLSFIAHESLNRKRYLMKKIILENIIEGYVKSLPNYSKDESIDGFAILEKIEEKSGLLVERASSIYSFSSISFQEFFAAKYIIGNIQDKTIEQIVKYHITDQAWREVFIMSSDMLPNADFLLNSIIVKIDMMAKSNKFVSNLLKLIDYESNSTDSTIEKYKIKSALVYLLLKIHDYRSSTRSNSINYYSAFYHCMDLTESIAGTDATEYILNNYYRTIVYYLLVSLDASIADASKLSRIAHNAALAIAKKNDNLNFLVELLESTFPPGRKNTRKLQDIHNRQLRKIINLVPDDYSINKILFDYDSILVLRKYLYATNLFIECLKVSVTRNLIKDDLLAKILK